MLIKVEDRRGLVAFGQKTEPPSNLLIGFLDFAEVLAEAILVELLAGSHVPEPAAVRADLVGEDHAGVLAVPDAAELELEVDQPDVDRSEHAAQEVVHSYRHVGDVVHLVLAGPAEAGDMLVGDHRVAERIVLVIVFDDRARQLRAFVDAQSLAERSRRHIPYDDFDRDDLDLSDQLLSHVEAADEVRRNSDRLESSENVLGNAIVEHALAADRAALLRVERRRVVLEILDQGTGLRTLIEDLRLAFVNLAAADHVVRFAPAMR